MYGVGNHSFHRTSAPNEEALNCDSASEDRVLTVPLKGGSEGAGQSQMTLTLPIEDSRP